MLLVLICFIVFSVILLQFKIFSVESDFNNFLVNFLLAIGLFSTIITNLKTVNLIIVIVIVLWAFLNKKWKFRFELKNIEFNFVITIIVGLFFIIFYNENGKFFIPHEDYLFYSRLSLDNYTYKKESISAPYNTFNYISGIDFYHFFELWTTSLGKKINGQNISLNLFFFSYPLATVLSLIGVKELINFWFPDIKKSILIGYVFFVFLFGFFFISQPWDSLIFLFNISGISISDTGGMLLAPKALYVIPIIISLFIFLNKNSQENLILLIFSCFLYYPLLPYILLSLVAWIIGCKIHSFRLDKFSLITILFLIFFLCLQYFYFHFSNVNIVEKNIKLSDFLTSSFLLGIIPGIVLKAIFIPIFGFGSILLIIYTFCKNFKIAFKNYLFYIILYLISFGIWVIFYKNLDAKQPFFMLIGSVLVLLSLAGIMFLLNSSKKMIAILIYVTLLFPGILKAYNYENQVKRVDHKTALFLKNIGKKRILYIPQFHEIKNIYSRNERVYTGINSFILTNDSLELISISSSFYLDTINVNESVKNSYLIFKKNSAFYNQCGYFNDSKLDCLVQYVKKYNIDYICTKFSIPISSNLKKVFSTENNNFYITK
jgi:hypothetical protein